MSLSPELPQAATQPLCRTRTTGGRPDPSHLLSGLLLRHPPREVVAFTIDSSHFNFSDEVVLVVAQSANGTGDDNWLNETVELSWMSPTA